MPSNFHGIGTINYGRREFKPDGSFVTTEWLIWGYVPISPVVSRRIAYSNPDRPYAQFDKKERYWIYEMTAPNRKEVFSVRGFVAGLIAPVIVFATCQEPLSRLFGSEEIPAATCIAIPLLLTMLPYQLRQRAITRMIRQMERTKMGLGPEFH